MEKENKNTEGPVCACGKVDLYEESLKAKNKDVVADSEQNKDDSKSKDKSSEK